MKVLHLTEAMGGGIVTITNSITKRQHEAGADVSLWYRTRAEVRDDEIMRSQFAPGVQMRRLDSRGGVAAGFLLFKEVRAALRSGYYDVVHLHSAIAGAVGRLAVIGVRGHTKVFYSPHGFPFLRLNLSAIGRYGALLVERFLAPLGAGLILTASSEQELANRAVRAPRTYLLHTGVPRRSMREIGSVRPETSPLTVGMVGRITYQKAPWRFAKIARELNDRARFVWVGDGSPVDVARWIGDAPVTVTGWVDSAELESLMDSFDVILFPTLWEGMALSLIQAQGQGLPAVVSDAIGNVDTVLDKKSGFVCASDDELLEATRRLLVDRPLRNQMSASALAWAHEALIDDNIGVDSLEIYANTSSRNVPWNRSRPRVERDVVYED